MLGVLPGLVGTIQATEAIKVLLGIGETLVGRLLLIDALTMQFRSVRIKRDLSCPMCGTRTISSLIDYDAFCGVTAMVGDSEAHADITPAQLRERLLRGDDFDLIDVREPHEWAQQHIDGARLIPLATLPATIAQLDTSREIVVMCRSGARSANAAQQLRDAGFARVANLTGGILRWNADTQDA